jgi:K+-dependent Na+/Ca+ exchanger-like protein
MGVAIVSLIVIGLCIYLLSIITDEFFITSLDQISRRWKLPSSVAGASLMAMGSSAPELAIALLALFKDGGENSDVGIGTIVGSAVFNILVITGVSAIARPARVTWRVVVRDVVVYVASIGLLLATFADGTITILEALAFLVLYGVYIYVLFQWKASEEIIKQEKEKAAEAKKKGGGLYHTITAAVTTGIGLLMGKAEKTYIRAFLVSILFIAVISWFLVEYAVQFAEALHIPPVIVALTILAGGTSVPDMIASVVVARQGRGEMAVANAVGSNIFDILVGLGLPWVIAIIVLGETVRVGTGDLWTSTIVLLSTVVLLFVLLTSARVLSAREGWLLLAAYVVYAVWVWLGG